MSFDGKCGREDNMVLNALRYVLFLYKLILKYSLNVMLTSKPHNIQVIDKILYKMKLQIYSHLLH